MPISRRRFIAMGGAGYGALTGLCGSTALAALAGVADADLVVFNAMVYTMDARAPTAEAFAVKGGRFIAVGTNADIKGLIGKRTETVDARRMTVVPGFNDCHNHAPGTTLLYEVLVGNPYEVEFVTIDSIVEKLRAKAKDTPADTWVEGFFFDDTKVKDKRALNVHDLDRVSTTLPVAVHHRGGHTAFYNSKALQMAGITRNSPPVPGGTYDRDANGELTGRVTDNAMTAVANVGKRATLHRRANSAARARRAGLHVQAIRAIWLDQRLSRGRQLAGAGTGPRAG
jgi:predicted amidohydrolase YtcJ